MDARRDSARQEDRKTAALAAAVFLFALALRLRGLGTVFPVNDEFMQFYEALRPTGWRDFLELLSHNPHHVLIDPLTTRLAAMVSPSLWSMRIPSALAGALGAWLTCRLGAREGRPLLGLAAGLLLSVSLLHLDWSRRADFYALLTLVSVWTTLDYFAVLDRPASWPRLTLSCAVFLYSHPYAVLMACFQALFPFMTVAKPRRREVLAAVFKAWTVAVLIFLPWFFFSTKALLNPSLFDFRGNPVTLRFTEFLAGLPAALAQSPEAGPIPDWARAAFAAFYAFGWASSLIALPRGKPSRLIAFSHAVLVFGFAAVVAADLRYHYYLAHRQLLWLLPFYLVAVADGWSRLVERASLRRALLAAAVLGGGLLAGGVTRWQEARTDGMRAFAAQVDRLLAPGDAVGFANDQLLAGFLFYYDRPSFRRIEGMRLVRGMMSYEFPTGRWVEHGGRALDFSAGAACEPSPRWVMCGTVYDTSLIPPLRQ